VTALLEGMWDLFAGENLLFFDPSSPLPMRKMGAGGPGARVTCVMESEFSLFFTGYFSSATRAVIGVFGRRFFHPSVKKMSCFWDLRVNDLDIYARSLYVPGTFPNKIGSRIMPPGWLLDSGEP